MDRLTGFCTPPIDVTRTRVLRAAIIIAAFIAQTAFSASISPIRTFSVKETVAIREAVAAAAIENGALHLLITDKAPTGRSAVLLQVDDRGDNRLWRDLKTPAVALVGAGGIVAAFNPIRDGLRLLQPTGDGARAVDLTGETAALTGGRSHLVRLLRNGDLAVHETTGTKVGAPRILPTSSILKVDSVCSTCGSKLIIPAAYVFSLLPGEKVAAVHRSTGSFKVLDLKTGKLLTSVALENEDLRRGRGMYAARPKAPASSTTSNPSLVIAGVAAASGDMFLLIGPFTPAEGARVIRVNPKGEVLASLRCAYPDFRPEDGPPQFLGVNGEELHLISRTGHVRVYSLTSAKVQ